MELALSACFQPNNLFARQHLNTLLLVEVGHKLSERTREDAISNIFAGEDHYHFFPVQSQCRSDLRTDKPAADHGKPPTRFGERAKTPVIRQGAEVNDLVVAERKASRPAARGQQEFLAGENVSLVVYNAFPLGNDLFDDTAQMNLNPLLFSVVHCLYSCCFWSWAIYVTYVTLRKWRITANQDGLLLMFNQS
jgi:hypothetical protein